MNRNTAKWLVITGVPLAAVVVTAMVFYTTQTLRNFTTVGQPQSSTDAKVAADIERVLTLHLSALGPGDPVYERYGQFQSLSKVQTYRDGPYYQNVVNLDFVATAHFAQADARLTMGINQGPAPAITQLQMYPDPQWRADNPQQAGTLQLVGNELWQVSPGSGRAPCTLDAWAVHPDFEP